ncbi:hypothetical protein NEDG_00554 [Nematocida displodere]|uniref:Origin recognition complex subunit 2 n=1 Tax=Nematocida displodere TaxID=1805483 RepID=A0A177ED16_9MICR|nr:hypothetical protein NEDG_00554 [Nematocida displodere]
MDWNAKISKKLLAFHQGSASEYCEILKTFNIYAYGHGNKLPLLKELFPTALIVDCKESDFMLVGRSIYEYFNVPPKDTEVKGIIQHVSTVVLDRPEEKMLILLNAKKDLLEVIHSLKVVLVQHREMYVSYNELIQSNFIFRDFSTFVLEEKEQAGKSSKVSEVFNIYDCVGPLSRKIFKLVLRAAASRAEFSLRDLFAKEKKKLLLVSFSSFREALSDFFDSKLLTETSSICKLHLTKRDLAEVIDIIEKTE